MQLDRNGLPVVVVAIILGTFVFASLTGTLGASLFSQEAPGQIQDPETEKKLRQIEERAQELAKRLEERFESAEWQARLQAIEERAEEIERRFSSPEFQARVKAIEEAGKRIEERFQGEQWQQFEDRIQNLGDEIGQYFQSDDWKEAMAQIQEETRNLNEQLEGQLLDDASWKAHQAEIEELTRSIQEMFGEDFHLQMKELQHQIQENLKDLPKREREPIGGKNPSNEL